ncbi:NUDIX domain-containing protein [Nannocystis radixulma]|uniref:NUDIX domain-containing protein n=1 Tax=Nannocystis radixulma TaxID=2995305 RepID=A0ABT5AWM4_9BACT|nr:NUDIX domain-containing protein [Nannocystis radixulma]MDC0666240.1 NUDIX domain-containing protein [Nannocystis radixulma]
MPRLAVRAILIEDDRILLAHFIDAGGPWYVTPGGGVQHGETIEEAFHRELHEELGARAEFGQVACIREIIADRLETTNLPAGFHQVEIFVHGRLLPGQELRMINPDPSQVGLVWVPLAELHTLPFFPRGLIAEFQARSFPQFYYGARR